MRIFEEVVEEDDEFAHHRGERDFLGLTGGEEPLIKRLEDRVEAQPLTSGRFWVATDNRNLPKALRNCVPVLNVRSRALPTGEPLAALDTKAREAKNSNLLGDHLDGSPENLPPPPTPLIALSIYCPF